MTRIVFILLTIFNMQDPEFDEKEIYGAWQWVQSSGGLLGNTITSENTKLTKKIVLTKDHVMMYYANDSLTLRQNYQIQSEKTIFSELPQPVLRLSGMVRTQTITTAGRDTLHLKDNAYDGYMHVYVRAQE